MPLLTRYLVIERPRFNIRNSTRIQYQQHLQNGRRLARKGQILKAIQSFEAALSIKPDDVETLFELGNVARRANMPEIAVKMFRTALTLRPDDPAIHNNLGNALVASGAYPEAIKILDYANSLTGNEDATTLASFAHVCAHGGQFDRAILAFERVIGLNPKSAPAYSGLAELCYRRHQFEKAIPYHLKAIKFARGADSKAKERFNLSISQLSAGHLADGWDNYEARLHPAIRSYRSKHGLKLWKGGDLSERRLLVVAEQGLGDQIELSSLLPEIIERTMECHLAVEPRLQPIFQRSFPQANVHGYILDADAGERSMFIQWNGPKPKLDLAISMASLPRFLRRDVSEFRTHTGVFVADTEKSVFWRRRFEVELPAAKPRIGICWRSGKLSGERWRNYDKIMAWKELLQHESYCFVNLQYDNCVEELANVQRHLGVTIHNFEDLDQYDDLDGTAAMIDALDFVIAAPTVVSQMAGALGVPSAKLGFSQFCFGYSPAPFQSSVRIIVGNDRFQQCLDLLESQFPNGAADRLLPGNFRKNYAAKSIAKLNLK